MYSACDSVFEEEKALDLPMMSVIKRAMFKKFDAWVNEQYQEEMRQRNA